MSQINQHGGGARRAAGRLLAGIAAGLALAVAAAAPAAADAPWGFEQVTPVDKGAGTVSYVDTFRARPDGGALLYTANAPMAGIPTESSPLYTRYFASRGDDGWHNRGLDPRYKPVYPNFIAAVQNVVGVSADLSHAAVVTTRALTPGATEGGGNLYVRGTSTGALTLVATSANQKLAAKLLTNQGYLSVKYVGPDGSLLFVTEVPLVPGAPDGTLPFQLKLTLYRWTPENGLEAVSILPGGTITDVGESVGYGAETGTRDSIPQRDGLARVYFTQRAMGPVWVRSGDETRLVSRSHIGGGNQDPVDAVVRATTDGGRYMLLTTQRADRLTADTPVPALANSQFLYRYDYATDELTYIATEFPWGTDRIIQMTQDGQTVAFQSSMALAGAAVEGALNIYVWRNGTVRFVATLDPESSANLGANWLRRLSPSGRYLAFTDDSTSVAQRVGFDNVSRRCPPAFNDDPGPCKLVYLYDADTDRLTCASCRQDGLPQAGQAGDPLSRSPGFIRLSAYQVRTVTDDGTVFFTSPDPLVPEDGNGADDAYASRDGRFQLLSRATQGTSSRFIDASEDGSTAFIATDDPILATDTDRAVDIYATRSGGGYPDNPPKVTPPCVESDCRAPAASPAAPPVAGSVAFSAAGPAKIQRQAKVKLKAIAGAAGSLKVTVGGKGRLTASGSGVRRVTRTVSRAATYTVRLSLTTAARRALKRSSTVRKTVKVTFTPSTGKASTVTLSLTFKASPSARKGR